MNVAEFSQSTSPPRTSSVPISQLAHVGIVLLLSRVLWSWHSGGIEWASEPDVVKWMHTHLAAPQMLVSQLLAMCIAACLTVGLFVSSPISLKPSFLQSSANASQIPLDERGWSSLTALTRDRWLPVVLGRCLPCALVTSATFMVGVRALWIECIAADLMDLEKGTYGLVDMMCLEWMRGSAPPSELVWTIYFFLGMSMLLSKCAGCAPALGNGVTSTASSSTLAGNVLGDHVVLRKGQGPNVTVERSITLSASYCNDIFS